MAAYSHPPVTRPEPVRLPPGSRIALGVAVSLVAILAVSPLASAAYTLGVSPPYPGVEPVLYTVISTTGCHSRGDFPLAPRVNATSGAVHERLSASSRYCAGGTVAPDLASVSSFPGFYGPNFTVPAAGSYTATFRWVFSYNASLNASGPVNTGSLTSSASAIVSIFALGYLYDSTNSTILTGTGGDAFALFHEIHEGSWSGGAVRQVVVLTSTFALVTGHVYYFETVLTTSAEGITYEGGLASASLDLGTHGDHARLVGLRLSGG